MDKYRIYSDIHDQIVSATFLAEKTDEGRLMVAVVGQAIQDAMGLWGADKDEVLSQFDGGTGAGRKYVKKQRVTRQAEAIEWLKAKGHYPWMDMLEIEPSWIDWLIKNKAGVSL